MKAKQVTGFVITQKELQHIMRQSCELNKINDNAEIHFLIEDGVMTVSHYDSKGKATEAQPEEPVNNAQGH